MTKIESELDMYQAALQLEAPWYVERREFDPETGRFDLYLNFDRKDSFTCATCGTEGRDNYPLSATSLNFMGDSTTGVFILLIQPGRRWIFSDKISAVYPLEITLSTNDRIIINDDNELVINSSF